MKNRIKGLYFAICEKYYTINRTTQTPSFIHVFLRNTTYPTDNTTLRAAAERHKSKRMLPHGS